MPKRLVYGMRAEKLVVHSSYLFIPSPRMAKYDVRTQTLPGCLEVAFHY